MLIGKLGQVVNILVDHDVEVVRLVVLGHIGRGEGLGHCDGMSVDNARR